MRPSPLLSAAAAAALLTAVAGPATAGSAPAPAMGVASSSVTLLGVAAGGHTVTAGTVELLSDMLGAQGVAKVLLTPLTADGTPYGQQTVTPASSPVSAASVDSSALVPALAGIASVRTPVLEAAASDTDGEPTTSAGAASLGALSVLGLPVSVNGSLDVGSAVSRTTGAVGEKTLVVENVALPSVADVLGALGLSLDALPVEVLYELLDQLELLTPVVDDAQAALDAAKADIQRQIDDAQAAVDAASADVTAALEDLAGTQSQLAAAEQDLQAATAALQPARDAVTAAQAELSAAQATRTSAQASYDDAYATVQAAATLLNMTVEQYGTAFPTLDIVQALVAADAALDAANAAVSSATAALDAAKAGLLQAESLAAAAQAAVDLLRAAVATAQQLVDDLQAVLDAAIALLNSILDDVQAQIDALRAAIKAVLSDTPLLSFDSLSVVTEATASSNTDGAQTARIVGGELSGLEVLGTDVLGNVLGTTTVDLLDITTAQLEALTGLIGGLAGTLSSVLSTVDAFPQLSIPAPQIGLLSKSTSTGVVDGFGVATTSVKGLSVTLPSVTIPTALALPGAIDLPALDGITQVAGLLTSAPVKIDLGTLSTSARFAPAAAGAPTTGTPETATPEAATPEAATPETGSPETGTPTTETPGTVARQLPRTGASQALVVLGTVLLVAAFATRRRSAELTDLIG